MTPNVTVTIDGARIRAAKGTSVLDAALGYGICIPHLCRVPHLHDTGACRLCIVENVENGHSKITTSCTLLVKEGMVILSSTEKIRKLRRGIAELLVAEAPNSRAIQDVALRCGVEDVRYSFRNNDCILCGRCVRVCADRYGAGAIGFVGRGKDRRVGFPFGERLEFCKQCGECISVCPMAMTPCDGPMKVGQERLCGKCEPKMAFAEKTPGFCVACDLGEGFQCDRQPLNY